MFKAMYGSADRGDQRFAANLRNTTTSTWVAKPEVHAEVRVTS
jgi:hypothetical protein